jgi:signal peptidase II
MKKIALITFVILLIDQFTKYYIKTHYLLGESHSIFPGFKFTFVENPGMAYGFHFGGLLGKYFLVLVRVVLIGGMIFLFKKWLREGSSNYLIIPMAMIFAGAIGNLIDGMFYGLIYDYGTVYAESAGQWIGYDEVSKLTQFGHGYSTFMKGCVVDMFHFPLVDWNVPTNWPLIGGQHIEFFKYIFNVADAAITIGAVLLFVFRKKAFPHGLEF